MSVVRLLVVDDSADFLSAATMLLGLDERLEVVGTVSSAAAALEFLEVRHVDLVLLDVNMPDLGGVEAAAVVTARYPEVVVVLCSTMTLADALAGAVGHLFLEKADLTPSALLDLWHSRAG